MIEEKKMKKVNFNIQANKWEDFKTIAKDNNSDATKELRKFIDRYLKDYAQGKFDL